GPAITLLNRDRLRAPPQVSLLDFGKVNPSPRISIIVPLYGRIDFLEYQHAFMSRHEPVREQELIYVLDDPPKRRQLERLADSVHERFRIPFRLVMLDRNLGFGPANNVGLAHARGDYVCFLNSDVFPGTPDWVERLVQRLEDNRDVGIIGPLLLFEDGSVQHE